MTVGPNSEEVPIATVEYSIAFTNVPDKGAGAEGLVTRTVDVGSVYIAQLPTQMVWAGDTGQFTASVSGVVTLDNGRRCRFGPQSRKVTVK